MKHITYVLAFFFCALISFGQCDYSLKMMDSYGDGWNGNTMNVSVDGTVVLQGVSVPSSGSELILPFGVTDGADITTEWVGGGSFGYETSYEILDSTGAVVGSGAETSITTGTIAAFCPTCIAPTALTVNSTSDVGATVSWTAEAGDTIWQYQLVLAGQTTSETGTDTTDNPLTITGCYANTSYDLYIRTSCSDEQSTWSMVSFTTLPVPFTMPGCFDFEAGILGANAALSSDIHSDASLDAGAAAFSSDFGILLTGGDSGDGWTGGSTSTSETQAWVDNVTHQSAVNITVDATAETIVVLSFDLKQTYSYGATYSNFRVTVDGAQIGATLRPTTADSDPFVNQYYDLSAYAGTSFNLKLEHSGKYNAAFAAPGDQSLIDNICLTAPSCAQPSAATTTSITSSAADLSWTMGASETEWNIEYGSAGFTQGTGTSDTTTATSYSLNGLDSNASYHFYIQANCGGSTSNWIGPIEFTTTPGCGDSLFDSGGATGDYSSNDLTTVTVYPDSTGDLVTFTFISFETENNYDFLTVYDGPDVTSTELGNFSGSTVPDPITSSHPTGALTFVFDSDGSVNDPGYEILVSCSPAPSCIQVSDLVVSTATGTSVDISWTANNGETTWEYVIQPQGTGEPAAAGTPITTNPYTITGLNSSTDYEVFVRAICSSSDSSPWRGPVNFTTSPACGDTLFDSGGATGSYGNNDLITTTVYADNPGDLVTFTFISFGTESCCDDLTVYDGPDINADVVGVYAGSTIPDPITSSHPTGALTFVFESDGSVTDIGYEILISCSPPPTCIQVSDVTATNITTTSVELGWTSYNSEVLWNIEYGAPDFVQGAGTSIVANTNPYTLTGLDSNATYDFYIQADCGAGDTSAWVGPLTFTTLPVPFTMPGCFDFEAGILGANAALSSDIHSDASLDAGAAAFSSDFGILLTGGDSGDGWTGGSTSTTETQAWVDNVTHQSAVNITVDATAETIVVLTFDLKQTYSYGATYSNFRVTVDGAQIGATLRPTTADSDPFVNQYYDLSAYAGTSFNLKLEHSGKYNAAFAAPGDQSLIDNICLTAPSCTQPSAATADAITTSSANINWTAGATETSWNIEYGPEGFTQGSGTSDTTTTTTYNLNGLDSNTTYHFYVQADCGTSTSNWVGPLFFTTDPSCGDTLFDSGGATGDYANNELTTVTIFPENAGDLVTFTFISFETEANWDTLTVYDGPDVTATEIGEYSGSTIPDAISSTDATGALTFVFDSDGSVNDPGYEILISCAPPPSCYPPTALTISNISGSTADFDWTTGTGNSTWEYVIVPTGDPAPTGNGTAVNVTSTQFTGLDFETTYDAYVRADCGPTDGYSTWVGPVTFTTMQQTNFTVDCASATPVNINYCYTDNDSMFWVFTSTNGYPLSVTFNAGTIENNYDDLTIYDGVDNTGTVLFNNNSNNTNDFADLVIESTSPSMYIEVTSDSFSSCDSSTLYTPWDFDVSCKTCITQTVDFNITGDCEVSQEFFIEVDVSDLGSATSVIISDNLASAEQTVTSAGVVSFGPYIAGVNVVISTVNGDDNSCVVNSDPLTFLCPPPPNDCSVIYAGEDTAFCEGTSTNLTATYHILGQDTSSYEINSQEGCPTPAVIGGTPTSLDIDDTWSDVIDLGFEFCFFGDTYSQILIGSNGVLSFEFENAGQGNGYSLGSNDTLPNSSNSTLSEANIFGVGHDIDPSVCGDINYVVLGAAPSRQFVVNYSEVCHFGSNCNDNKSTTQIILYESSNAIDVNIFNKPTCTSWNDGNAVVGVQNILGTVAFTPPGRNTGVWDTTDEFWRFTPSLGTPDFTIEWFDGETSIGTGETVTVAPTETTTYTAAITYSLCTGGTATLTDTVDVGIYPTPDPIPTESTVYRCSGESSILEVTVTNSDVLETMTYYWTYEGVDVQSGPDNTYEVPADSDQIGEFLVTVIDERNCYGETTITLVSGVTPELENDTVFTKCIDGEIELEANVLNADLLGSDLEYVWSVDGVEVQSSLDNTFLHTSGLPLGFVEVVVIDLMTTCEASTLIEVANGVRPQLENDTVFTKCIDGEIELEANVLNADLLGSDLEYVWSVDGVEVQSSLDNTFLHTSGLPLGFVEVVVIDLMTTCEASTLIEVANGVRPQLENGTVFTKCMDENVDLSVNVLNTDLLGSDLEYVWYIGGSEVQSGSENSFTHLAGESFGSVEVVVIDLMTMCETSTMIEVQSFMNANCVDIPQGLSPNGDGMNDCLVLDHLEASDDIVRAEIYNRYGVKVFELNDYTSQWCGQDASSGNSDSNDLLPVGTYFYVIQFNSGKAPITSWIYLNY